jgi:beta-glucanase (GH16 family)
VLSNSGKVERGYRRKSENLTRVKNMSVPIGYKLVFDDDFNGYLHDHIATNWGPLAAGKGKWICHTPSDADYGDAYFTGVLESANPFAMDGQGSLVITAKEDLGIGHWRSGMIAGMDIDGGGFTQALGYWEARLKIPVGMGVWPSFWLETENVKERARRTANAGEIDVMEMFGVDMSRIHMNTHIWTPAGNDIAGLRTSSTITLPSMITGWHIFGCLVATDRIHFYLDGEEEFSCVTDDSMKAPMFAMVSVAMGGFWPIAITDPVSMKIDYVRCYAKV